jgi:hypothetical protein
MSLEGASTGMTIQPTSSAAVYSGAPPTSTKSAPATPSTQQPAQDTVQLSAQAKASLDKDHDGDSH